MIDRARHWAELACHAPSGDNSQPWQVAVNDAGGRLTLTLGLDDATRAAPSLFDCAFVASYLSLGAYARNFLLLAASEGWSLTGLQEDAGRFILTLAPAAGPAGTLAPTPAEAAALVRRRATNRLPFRREPLDDATRAAFARLAAAASGRLSLREVTGEEKSRLARIFYALDQIRYRTPRLYREFLEKLRFGAEAGQTRDGLQDTTLGAPKPALLFLRLLRALRKVRAVHALFFLGLQKIMAFVGCLLPVRNSAAVFFLTTDSDTPLGWFHLGLAFEELWLEATCRDLALQPLGTTLLIYRRERERRLGEVSAFSTADGSWLQALAERGRTEFGLDLGRPGIAFRVGRGPVAAGASLRRPLVLADFPPGNAGE
jgi:hypothetical protein